MVERGVLHPSRIIVLVLFCLDESQSFLLTSNTSGRMRGHLHVEAGFETVASTEDMSELTETTPSKVTTMRPSYKHGQPLRFPYGEARGTIVSNGQEDAPQ